MVVWRLEGLTADDCKDKYVSYDLEELAPFVLELVKAFQIPMPAAWLLQIWGRTFMARAGHSPVHRHLKDKILEFNPFRQCKWTDFMGMGCSHDSAWHSDRTPKFVRLRYSTTCWRPSKCLAQQRLGTQQGQWQPNHAHECYYKREWLNGYYNKGLHPSWYRIVDTRCQYTLETPASRPIPFFLWSDLENLMAGSPKPYPIEKENQLNQTSSSKW